MSGLLSIGVQALTASRLALDITGQNIANVNTVGYSRQQVELASRADPEKGVFAQDVGRVADQFATRQLWSDTAASTGSNAFVENANQLDDLLASSDTSISASMDLFFGALQTGVDDPASLPSREVILAQGEALVRRFQALDGYIEQQNSTVNSKVRSLGLEVTQISSQIATLNEKLSFSRARQEPGNELKDQRDELVRQLSEIIGVTVQQGTDDEDFNIFIGNGQPLVVGNSASRVSVLQGNPDPEDLRVVVEVAGKQVEVGAEIRSGEMGGLLTYRDEVLENAWNELGRLAIVFSDTMNQQHRKGLDLAGELGGDFFNDLNRSGTVRALDGNLTPLTRTPTVEFTDTSALKASDYSLAFQSASSFELVRTSDGKVLSLSDFTFDDSDPANQAPGTYSGDLTTGELRINFDGMTLTLNGRERFQQGDKFLIQAVRNGAEDIGMDITEGRELAFASPIRTQVSPDNSGTVNVDSVEVTDPTNASFTAVTGELSPPVEIVFNSTDPITFDVLDISDPSNPVPYLRNDTVPGTPLTGQTYTAGESIQLNGFAVTLTNEPLPGDRVDFTFNVDGEGDNRNAFLLSGLQVAGTIEGSSYQSNYGQLVEFVGAEANVAQISARANESVLLSTKAIRDGIAGVNLDEEAAKIVKFQQAYQASTQLISTSRTIFDALLAATGG